MEGSQTIEEVGLQVIAECGQFVGFPLGPLVNPQEGIREGEP